VDGLSRCLVPAGWSCGPFRPAIRSARRLTGSPATPWRAGLPALSSVRRPGCGHLRPFPASRRRPGGRSRFAPVCASWPTPVSAASAPAAGPGKAAGVSGGKPADLILSPEPPVESAAEVAHWLLSLYSPAPTDMVQWGRGQYSLLTRAGRVESPSGRGGLKRLSRMVAEGSAIFCQAPPSGGAQNVAPEGVPHPVYRAGFALAVAVPFRGVPK